MLQQNSEQQWEDAYRGLVAELESKERRWTEVENDLRQAATALAIAAMGHSDTQNQLLEKIIAVVRDETDPLAPEIARLNVAVRSEIGNDAPRSDSTEGRSDTPPPDEPTESILDLRIIVQVLTRKLAAVPDLAEVSAQIEAQCENPDWSAALTSVANSIAQVVSSLQAERRELEEFLAGVTTQLAALERWTQWHLSDTQQRRDSNSTLENSVRHEMDNLHAEVQSTENLNQLKSTVQVRLQAMTESMRKFRETEARRLSAAQSRNAELAGEVNRLQKRASELSELCGDQHNRLMVDALTGVHSRYAYEQRLQQEFERWQSGGAPLAFTLWDIDKFKSINDQYGHDAGDRLLRRIGLIFNKHKRKDDFVARIGGEEFVILLQGVDVDAARAIADRLREVVARTPFNYRGTRRQITISCGVTQLREGDSPLSVYKRADQALYDAKNTGRDRVISN